MYIPDIYPHTCRLPIEKTKMSLIVSKVSKCFYSSIYYT